MHIKKVSITLQEARVIPFSVQYGRANIQIGIANIQIGIANIQIGIANIQIGIANIQIGIANIQIGIMAIGPFFQLFFLHFFCLFFSVAIFFRSFLTEINHFWSDFLLFCQLSNF